MSSLRTFGRRLASYAALYAEGSGVTSDRPLRGPLYAQISVSDACNHQCVMCPYHPPGRPADKEGRAFAQIRPGVMDVATFRRLVDDLHALGTLQVDLVGRGEPLLHPACPELVAYAVDKGLEVVLTTNASRLDADRARALVDAGLHRLKVSLNAGRSETYPSIHVTESADAHRAVLENVRTLTSLRRRGTPHVTLSFTLLPANADELDVMLDRVVETGADAGWFQHVIDDGTGLGLSDEQLRTLVEERIPRALEHARKLGVEHNLVSLATSARPGKATDGAGDVVPCYVGSYFTSVLGNGQVVPCCQINRAVGSLKEASFQTVWKSEEYRAFRRAARHLPEPSPVLATAECDRCYFRPHNRTIHAALHPLDAARSEATIPLRHLWRMVRTDKP